MRCQICGAELTKPGDICNNCMNEILEEREYKKDDEAVFVLKKKFKFFHQCGYYFESAILLIIMLIASIQISVVPVFLLFATIMLIAFFINMYLKKKKIESAKYTFYKTKLVYEYTFFRKEAKTIKYKDIKEITYTQSFWERFFNLGQVQINTNSGNIFNNGIDIDCVENIEKVFKKIKTIVNK